MVIISWFGSGAVVAWATITHTSAFYLLVFIPIAITFEYAMKKKPVNHKPQKHRLPRLSLSAFMLIAPLLAAAGYFRNPRQYHIFIILYVLGMGVLSFYGWMASQMSKSLDETAEIDAIIWLLRSKTSPNPDLLEKACRIVSGPSGRHYQPKILESLMPFLSSLIVSNRPDMGVEELKRYLSCLAYLANFENQKGSWWLLREDARSHPKLKEPLLGRLVELAKHELPVGMVAREVLRLFDDNSPGEKPFWLQKRQMSGPDTSSMMSFVESAHSYEEMQLQSRRKGGYYSVDA